MTAKCLMVISHAASQTEIPGYLANEILSGKRFVKDSPEAEKIRSKLQSVCHAQNESKRHKPMVIWRHHAGGIDINRDWVNFNPTRNPRALSKILWKIKVKGDGGKFIFPQQNFHATWEGYFPTRQRRFGGEFSGFEIPTDQAILKEPRLWSQY